MKNIFEVFKPAPRCELDSRFALFMMDVICETARFDIITDEGYLEVLCNKFGMSAQKAMEWIKFLKDIGLVGQDDMICVDNMRVSYAVDSPYYRKLKK